MFLTSLKKKQILQKDIQQRTSSCHNKWFKGKFPLPALMVVYVRMLLSLDIHLKYAFIVALNM